MFRTPAPQIQDISVFGYVREGNCKNLLSHLIQELKKRNGGKRTRNLLKDRKVKHAWEREEEKREWKRRNEIHVSVVRTVLLFLTLHSILARGIAAGALSP